VVFFFFFFYCQFFFEYIFFLLEIELLRELNARLFFLFNSADNTTRLQLLVRIDSEEIAEGHSEDDGTHWDRHKEAHDEEEEAREHEQRGQNDEDRHFKNVLVDHLDAEKHGTNDANVLIVIFQEDQDGEAQSNQSIQAWDDAEQETQHDDEGFEDSNQEHWNIKQKSIKEVIVFHLSSVAELVGHRDEDAERQRKRDPATNIRQKADRNLEDRENGEGDPMLLINRPRFRIPLANLDLIILREDIVGDGALLDSIWGNDDGSWPNWVFLELSIIHCWCLARNLVDISREVGDLLLEFHWNRSGGHIGWIKV